MSHSVKQLGSGLLNATCKPMSAGGFLVAIKQEKGEVPKAVVEKPPEEA